MRRLRLKAATVRTDTVEVDRLSEDTLVVITLPQEARRRHVPELSAHVVAVAEDLAALEPVDAARANSLPPRLEGVHMSFRHGSSLVALLGVLERLPTGDLGFRVSDGIQMRRQRPTRVSVSATVTLRRPASDAGKARTVNLSANGVLVETDLATEVGEDLDVVLALPGGHEAGAVARVVRCADGLVAMQFTSFEGEGRETVGAFVVARARRRHRRRVASVAAAS